MASYFAGRSNSITLDVPVGQIAQIIFAIVLPQARMGRVGARIHLDANVKRIAQEGKEAEKGLEGLGRVHLDCVLPEP